MKKTDIHGFWNDYWTIDNDNKDFKYRNVPDSILSEYIDVFPRGRVLDLGMGEGRNAFYRIGFKNVKLFGDLAGTEYGLNATRLIAF